MRFIAILVIKKDTVIKISMTKKLVRLAAAAIRGRSLQTAAANAAPALTVPAVPNKKYRRSLNGYCESIYLPLIREVVSRMLIIIILL